MQTRTISITIFLLVAVAFAAPNAYSQWFGRIHNTIGHWQASADNRGIVFNNDNRGGGLWNTQTLVFGAGLWIGGIINCPTCKKAPVAMSVTYDPNSARTDFVPGSAIYDGASIDSSTTGSLKYQPTLSSSVPASEWPMRLVGQNPSYIDVIPSRQSAGPAYMIGDEDIFTIYKNTDRTFWTPNDTTNVPRFEIRTQIGFWGSGFWSDVVVVKNELIYLGSDTILNPAIALAFDGDIGSGGSAVSNNYLRGFLDSGVNGCMFRSGSKTSPAQPLLGVYFLRGISSTHISDPGLTTLRRWTIYNDPGNSDQRYNFMTSREKDILDTGGAADVRVLLSSMSTTSLLPGDTLHFDYALCGVQPSNSNPFDTTAIVNCGKIITALYQSGQLGSLAVHSNSTAEESITVYPNPAGDECTIVSSSDPIVSIELFNTLGISLDIQTTGNNSRSAWLHLDGRAAGPYYAKINGRYFVKILKR